MRMSLLLDFYGALITDRKREVMTLYIEQDNSFSEIASELKTSRQSVFDAVKVATKDLEKYEEKLKCVEKYLKNREIIIKCLDDLEGLDDTNKKVQNVKSKLKNLLENQ